MTSDIPKYLRRKPAKEKSDIIYLFFAILFFLFALAYFADQVGMTNVAKAQRPPMTEKEACQSMKGGYPVMTDGVSNKELRAICASYGVRLTTIHHYEK